ncbi:MAG TPA: LPXTG cell wall anchor domain-containing protein [Longimicrobiales bacterium]
MADLNIRPKTGSESHVWLWTILIVAIIVVAIYLVTR